MPLIAWVYINPTTTCMAITTHIFTNQSTGKSQTPYNIEMMTTEDD
jgi:hypothetical protein